LLPAVFFLYYGVSGRNRHKFFEFFFASGEERERESPQQPGGCEESRSEAATLHQAGKGSKKVH